MSGSKQGRLPRWAAGLLLLLILVLGGYLRTVGLDWDAEQHLHPDERFLTMVESSIQPVQSLSEYFNSETSSLNPNNHGYGFYVYGTLPIFLVRYLAEWSGQIGYGSVYLVGRMTSAAVDLLTVFVVFLLGTRLFDRRVGLLASAFSAFAVLQIQQAHFFTVDSFTTFFMALAMFFAVEVATSGQDKPRISSFLLFGISLGMAAASKINAVPIALTLPLAAAVFYFHQPPEAREGWLPRLLAYLGLGAITSLLTFRIAQPYAFSGPGFFGLMPNEQWVSGLKALHAQTTGDVDFPPALQWARRTRWFSLKNMVLWGMGLPYGLLAWSGFLTLGWGIVKERVFDRKLLLWSWTALYFVWQSLQWNSTLRYQLPIYPLLAVFAAWLVFALWDRAAGGWKLRPLPVRLSAKAARTLIVVLAALILGATFSWAFAFSRVYPQEHPRVKATRWIFDHIPGAATLVLEIDQDREQQLFAFPENTLIEADNPWQASFVPDQSGTITALQLPGLAAGVGQVEEVDLTVRIKRSDQVIRELAERVELKGGEADLLLEFTPPVPLEADETYSLQLELSAGDPPISLQGAAIANESSWDDGLPLRMEGYDPFGGIYQGGLNFEMYWDDNREKLERFLSTLDRADYVLITSSRQWASTTRVPERYPLTTEYYRQLLGCPPEKTVEWCYNVAQPGRFAGNLGFELIRVFESPPTLGPIEINDQFAEEAFTVYDHPKVFVFRKDASYDAERTARLLGAVDLDKVIHLTPREAAGHPGDLMLPPARLAEQRAGGTWDELFNVQAPHNSSQLLGTAVWYLSVTLLGLIVFPLGSLIFSGLDDGGYPLARTLGLLLLSYLVWLAGSVRIPFQRLTIGLVLLLLAAAGGFAAHFQRERLGAMWRKRKRYFLLVEALALAVFVIGLLVRFGNPDLWHPWKGGEKPMDFSYFNAVLKSTSFPPYDPWFAGGYINYYYYGFVLVGVLVKFLGLVPSFAYNLILPTLLMMIALGSFSLVWNILRGHQRECGGVGSRALVGGLGGMVGMVLLGNLGTVRMIFRGLQRLASPGADLLHTGLFKKLIWTVEGLGKLGGASTFPFRLDEWYWNPSRAIAAEHGGPITEFPVFTFLYGDLHAHFIALPLTLLVLGWALSVVLRRLDPGPTPRGGAGKMALTAAAGGLLVGVLRPTNTWDFYPYLALGAAALLYAWWMDSGRLKPKIIIRTVIQITVFLGLAFLFFRPYSHWYGQGYSSVTPWTGTRTPLGDYLTHWGLFLFVVVSWMGYETLDWMARTPLSALQRLRPYRELIVAGVLLLLVIMVSLGFELNPGLTWGEFKVIGAGVHIIWLVLPLMVWAGILLFLPGVSHAKRTVLFMIGTALAMTLAVELIRLEGDIGRMNTVFKFYLGAWTLLAASAGAGLGWLLSSWARWPVQFRGIWQVALTVVVAGAALYPLLGGMAKIKDRMTREAPHTLNGMAFLKYADYQDLGTTLDLREDYLAIRWMQENIPGSPVIVEANQVEYHWGTRYTVYTGLPGVVGWNWHQRQQRTLTPHEWVFERVDAVNSFYDTTDLGAARDFLRRYEVEYLVVGQLERAKYDPAGIDKFQAAEGVLWETVFQTGETTLYRTLLTY